MKIFATLLFSSGLILGITMWSPAQNNSGSAVDPFIKNSGNSDAAGTKETGPAQNCMLVLEVYALDKNDALAVLESHIGSSARYSQVIDLAKSGKARLEILTALNNKSGKRALMESICEMQYPTSFIRQNGNSTLAIPTAYEVRNIGDMLESEVVLGPNGNTCDLNFVPQHIGLPDGRNKRAMTNQLQIAPPPFTMQKAATSTTFPINEPHYFGTLTPASERGAFDDRQDLETWLAFIHINVAEPDAGESKLPAKPMDWTALNLEYSFYSLDRAAAREILVAKPSVEGPWKAVQALLGEQKARFEHVISVQTRSGEHSITEEMQEISYPAKGALKAETAPFTSGDVPKTDLDSLPLLPEHVEKRNAGLIADVQPVVSPNGLTISIYHDIQSVAQVGDLKDSGLGNDFSAQALFETRHMISSQTLYPGLKMLMGTFNPAGEDGVKKRDVTDRTWFIFVRATPNEP